MTSQDYLFRCMDIMKADPNLSEETKVIMFMEYAKQRHEELLAEEWKPYAYVKPQKYGKYEVYRQGCNKQHYEVWNGISWAYNDRDITHFREIKKPKL